LNTNMNIFTLNQELIYKAILCYFSASNL